jgi:uncharacterized membrane protein YccC
MSRSAASIPAQGTIRVWAWFPALWLRNLISPNFAFALRTLTAMLLAVYVSYALMLETPFSAATTVLIVSNPMQGALLSKSVWRIVGTLAGAIAAVTLIALFAQAPFLFIIGIALWIGICTATANVLRYFRSYAAVLSGYTVALVAFAAIYNPDRIFDLAMARVAVVTIGVCSAGLVSSLLQPRTGQRSLTTGVGRLYAGVAHVLRTIYAGERPRSWAAGEQTRLLTEIHGLNDLVAYTTTESADVALRADTIREALAKLASAVSTGPLVADMLEHTLAELPEAETLSLRQARAIMASLLADLSEPPTPQSVPAARRRIEAAQEHLHALPRDLPSSSAPEPASAPAPALPAAAEIEHEAVPAMPVPPVPDIAASIRTRIMLTRLEMLLRVLSDALDGLLVTGNTPTAQLPPRFRFYQDPIPPLRNGVRAFFAIVLAGTFWVATYWSSGPSMMTILGPLCGLLAISSSPAKSSIDFFIGTILAAIGGFIAEFCLLPQTNSYPLMALVLSPFILMGVMGTQNRRYAGISTSFLIWFTALLGITNPVNYDLTAYLNASLAFILGSAFAVLSFRVLFPPSAHADVVRIAEALRRDVQRIASVEKLPAMLVWEHLQQQKLVRIAARMPSDTPNRAAILSGSIETLLLGRLLLRLRMALKTPGLPAAAVLCGSQALRALNHVTEAPEVAATAALDASHILTSLPLTLGENTTALLDAAALLREIGELVRSQAAFLAGKLD